jgi:hypothetical protein
LSFLEILSRMVHFGIRAAHILTLPEFPMV